MDDNNGSTEQREHLGRIDNPYAGKSDAQIRKIAHDFCDNKHLPHAKDLFYKAAWLIRNPEGLNLVPDIKADELSALKSEPTTTFFDEPKQLQINVLTLCVAAIVQGWNQTSANGANLGWPQSFDIGSNWAFGGINAATYFAASLVGCWLSDPLNEVAFYKVFFGRRAAICTSAIIILGATIGCAAAQTWRQLLGFRILLGIGMGSKAAVVPVFTAEIAPSRIRGSLVMTWQLFDAFGLFLGFTANLAVSQTGCNAWRWQIACSLIAIIVLLSLIFVCVESPRFLVKHNQYPKALRTLNLLKNHPIMAARDLLYMHEQIEQAERGPHSSEASPDGAVSRKRRELMQRSGLLQYLGLYLQHLGELFSEPPIRRATVAAVVCMFGQQLCGVNVLAFYSSSFFVKIAAKDYGEGLVFSSNDANCTPSPAYMQSLWFSWGIIGAVNFLAGIPAYFLIDSYGRRGLLLIALPFMCMTMMAAGLGFLADSSGVRAGIVGTFVFFFMFFYSWSMGPVPFTVSAEVFPLETRVPGMSFAVFTNFFGCGLLALFVPPMSQKLSYGGLLGLFAGFNLMLFFLVFFFVRDTAGITIASVSAPPPTNVAPNANGTADQQAPQQPGQNGPQQAKQQAASTTREVRVAKTLTLEELYLIFEPKFKDYRAYQLQIVFPWLWNQYIAKIEQDPLESFSDWAQRVGEARAAAKKTPDPGPTIEMDQLHSTTSPGRSEPGEEAGSESMAHTATWVDSATAHAIPRTGTDGSGGDSLLDLNRDSGTTQSGMGGSGSGDVRATGSPSSSPPSSAYRTAREGRTEPSIALRLRPTSYSRPL